jgi:hypothetical protein
MGEGPHDSAATLLRWSSWAAHSLDLTEAREVGRGKK